jgi:hypothetical protein
MESVVRLIPESKEGSQDDLRKAVISFQQKLEDYKHMRDGWKPQTPQYETYDLMVREYRKIIDILLPITFLDKL